MTASSVIKFVNTFIAVLLLAMTPSMRQHADSAGSHLLIFAFRLRDPSQCHGLTNTVLSWAPSSLFTVRGSQTASLTPLSIASKTSGATAESLHNNEDVYVTNRTNKTKQSRETH